MSAVADETKEPAAKFGSRVDEQIAQATSRIRVHDLALGGLTLTAMAAVYATALVVLDKYLNLAEWMRQLALAGFLAACAAVGYFLLVRPLTRRINPLYAAARVEDTIDDAKNSVTGYVDAQENGNAPAVVRAALAAKAAKAVGEADVNRAVDHRSLLVAGGVLVVFLVTLAVLFFVFRPTQFASLVGRAFVPFSSAPIATRTQLTLLKPDPADPIITTGQTITVGVYVGGKVPGKDAPDRVRVLLRHNPADPNYEELPMATPEGGSSRDFQVKVPEYLVQNGFWYKVAAGDAETPEFQVTVRSLPMFTAFEASYDYPKYTRRPPDVGTDPNLRAYRGTRITLLARTNREVKDGLLKFDAAGLPPVAGRPVAGRPDTLAFSFTATEPTRYRLYLTSTTGEQNSDPPPFQITIDADSPPRVEITTPPPEQPEATAPANGQLAVDGTIGDDFGIDKVRMMMRVGGRPLAPVFYQNGDSLRREADGTWPRDLPGGFKLSADLTRLRFADGTPYAPGENDRVEFWVEAIDNCTVTPLVAGWGGNFTAGGPPTAASFFGFSFQRGQVGRSDPRTLRLTTPKADPAEKEQLDRQKEQRQNAEQQHNAEQQKKFDAEDRPPPQGDPNKQPQQGRPEPKDGRPQDNPQPKADGKKDGDPKQDGRPEAKGGAPKDGKSEPKGGEPKDGAGGKSGKTDGTPPKAKDGTNPPEPGDKKVPGDPMGSGGDPGTKQPDAKSLDKGNPDSGAPKKGDPKKGGTPPDGGMGGTGPNDGGKSSPMPEAPPPKTPEQRNAERDAERVQEELNKNKGLGGDAKPNPTADAPENRTDPAQAKPQPTAGGEPPDSPPKEGPKPADPMTNPSGDKTPAADSKPQGNLEKPADPNPQPKPQPDANAKPAEQREQPLGGTPGQDKPEPKKDTTGTEPKGPNDPKGPTEPKEAKEQKTPNQDPKSGSAGKPDTTQAPQGGDQGAKPPENPADRAGAPKPNPEPARGQDKTPAPPKGGTPPDAQPKEAPAAGAGKPQQAPSAGAGKPEPKKDGGTGGKAPDASESKPEPKGPDGKPMGAPPAENRPEPPTQPMGGPGDTGDDRGVKPGTDKPVPGEDKPPMGGGGGGPKDKKEQKGGGGEGKIDEKQLKELQDAARDLDSPDPDKRKAAQDKLDKAIGEEKRKELEQMVKDLKSDDRAIREAAQKKLEDLKRQAEQQAKKDGKGQGQGGKPGDEKKGLTPEEAADLAKKAQDLNSPDEQKRREAEQALDEKIGKEAREKLQEEMKNQPKDPADPKQQEELRKQLEEMAKRDPQGEGARKEEFGKGGGRDTEGPNPEDPADPRNKAKTAQLQLEEFEKNRYNKALQDKLGWTQEQYDAFLKAQTERASQLQKEADRAEAELRDRVPTGGAPTIAAGGAEKVESGPDAKVGPGSGTGSVFAPPGFEKAREKFLDAIKGKADPKK